MLPVKYFIKHILIFSLILFTQNIQGNPNIRYGLSFKSYEVEKEERTMLDLTSEGHLSFRDGFILEFDVSFHPAQYSFGYVLRITGKNNEHIDLLITRKSSIMYSPQITAIYKSKEIICNSRFEDLNVDFNQWIPIKLTTDRKNKKICLTVNGKEFIKTDDYFGGFNSVDIIFGKNNNISYQTSDVPDMSLKDIKIKDLKEKELYHWKLSQHTKTGVYDDIKKRFALCESPNWIIDDHSFWENITTFDTGSYPQLTFNNKENIVTVADMNTLYVVDIKNNNLNKHAYDHGFPLGRKANQLLYNTLSNNLFTYDFVNEIATYNPATKTWNNNEPAITDPVYWHHNRYFSALDTTLYTFGGYGFHIYKNEINKYHFPSRRWETIPFTNNAEISPRYLSGLGVIDDKTLLIFGGYGNETGDQELSPRNYYDLYTYDITTHKATKIWELDPTKHNFVVANSLVVDKLENCFYALCFRHQKFNTKMQLYRFSLTKPVYEVLADSIPFMFNDNHSYADLYLTNDKEKLIAVTSFTEEKADKATISIYTLAFPPLKEADLYQKVKTESKSYIYIIVGIFLLLIVSYIVWKRKSVTKVIEKPVANSLPEPPVITETSTPIKPVSKPAKQSILLLGGFQVLDKNSNVITGEFTPILKQLFLLILLYTLKDGKGISSVKLREILWFDKTNDSAKNNRGVSLSKLRMIFEKIGDISINSRSSYWTVHFGADIYCDYHESLTLMDRIASSPDINDIKKLVPLVSAGDLLPNLQAEWLDHYKSNFANKLIDLLLDILSNADKLQISQSLMLDIADAIFAHDSLNEDALHIKCKLLVEMGKNGLAQKTYTSFIKEYQSLFGAEFKTSFEQIIS